MLPTNNRRPKEAAAYRLGFILMLLSIAFIMTAASTYFAVRAQSPGQILYGLREANQRDSLALSLRLPAVGAPAAPAKSVEAGTLIVSGGDHPVYLPIVAGKGTSAPTVTPTPTATPTSTLPSNRPTLLKAYLFREPQYEITKYRPRQFAKGMDADPDDKVALVDDPGPYAGWDLLNTPNEGHRTILDLDDWIKLTLNRPAVVAIVWRGGSPLPNWLASWNKNADVTINGKPVPTYRKTVQAGELQLGSVYDPGASGPGRDTYLILFAEQDGSASSAPTVPTGLETPQPNATCPKWVHDQYVALGPDGKYYPTWHPQIDPVYWCYFHHEHGSNPSPYKPLFGYAATQGGMSEGHEGFKVYKLNMPNDTTVIITHHFGTANPSKAACVRFHTFDMVAYKAGVLVVDIHLMADHGKSVHLAHDDTETDLRPPTCPNQAAEAEADNSAGVRKFQIASLEPQGYEPWRIDFAKVILGLVNDEFTINTPSRIADCNSLACDANVPTGDQGEFRFLTIGDSFGIKAATHTGVFYTDHEGRMLMQAGETGAVRQYVAPGTNITLGPILNGHCYISNPFGGDYVCQDPSPIDEFQNIENALQSPN